MRAGSGILPPRCFVQKVVVRPWLQKDIFHYECRVCIMRPCFCLHPKKSKMSYRAVKYMKMSKTFVNKWMKLFRRNYFVKNIDNLPDCGSVQKTMKKEDRVYRCLRRILVYHCVAGKRFCVKKIASRFISCSMCVFFSVSYPK